MVWVGLLDVHHVLAPPPGPDEPNRRTSMSKLWSLVIALTFVAFVSTAFAADAPKKKEGAKRPSPEQIFKKLDADKDGKLTAEELAKSKRLNGDVEKAKAIVAKMDENNDGVCLVEFTKAMAKRHAEHGQHGPKKEGAKAGEKKDCPKKECEKKE